MTQYKLIDLEIKNIEQTFARLKTYIAEANLDSKKISQISSKLNAINAKIAEISSIIYRYTNEGRSKNQEIVKNTKKIPEMNDNITGYKMTGG